MSESMYHGSEYLKRNPSWHVEDSGWKASLVMRMLARNGISPTSVCEVGCGAGEILRQLHAQLPSHVAFTGYDLAPDAIALCRQRAADRLEFHLADATEEELDVDVLLVLDVVEHVDDFYGFLRGLRAKSRFTVFHIPLDMSLLHIVYPPALIASRTHYGHIHYFMYETAISALVDAGYTVVDSFYTSAPLQRPRLTAAAVPVYLARLARRSLFAIRPSLAAKVLSGTSILVLTTNQ